MKNNLLIAAIGVATLWFVGCTVGPDFQKPVAPAGTAYSSAMTSNTDQATNQAGGTSQRFVTTTNIVSDWWTLFHCPALDQLIAMSLSNSPTIKSADAALTVAHENMLAGKGVFYPQVSASFGATRSRTSAQISPVPNSGELNYYLFTPQVTVSYALDVWGLNRRTLEVLKTQEASARFQLAAAHITLSANIAAAAVQEAALRAQIDATRRLIAINANMVGVLQQQLAKGAVAHFDVANQQSQLAQNEAALPGLFKQLAQQRDLLAALAGKLPGDPLPQQFQLADLQLPSELPLTLPSQLIEQRPDVRMAEENYHAACAQLGVATANRLPNITLSADAGTMALTIAKMFADGSGFYDLGVNAVQPIFEGGTLLHQQRAAKAAYAEAGEQYRNTVLTAFQNVADTLNALQQDAAALASASRAASAAKVALDLANQKLRTGNAQPLDLLTAEQMYQQAELNRIQAQANRYADTAALFQALGGGWTNQP